MTARANTANKTKRAHGEAIVQYDEMCATVRDINTNASRESIQYSTT